MVVDDSYNRDIKNKQKSIAYQKAACARQLADNPASVPIDNQHDFINVMVEALSSTRNHEPRN